MLTLIPFYRDTLITHLDSYARYPSDTALARLIRVTEWEPRHVCENLVLAFGDGQPEVKAWLGSIYWVLQNCADWNDRLYHQMRNHSASPNINLSKNTMAVVPFKGPVPLSDHLKQLKSKWVELWRKIRNLLKEREAPVRGLTLCCTTFRSIHQKTGPITYFDFASLDLNEKLPMACEFASFRMNPNKAPHFRHQEKQCRLFLT